MDTKESAPAPAPVNNRKSRLAGVAMMLATLGLGSGAFVYYSFCDTPANQPKPEPKGAAWSYDTVFPNWPKDKKPEFVIALTGQTYGYLQKCGCSDPQKGGLERRWNFFEGFKALGIECVPLDLGDVSPHMSEENKLDPAQAVLKYATAMRAMKAMGYRAVGLGKEEFALGLLEVIAAYALQQGNDKPQILGANFAGLDINGNMTDKALVFPNAKGEAAIRDWEIIPATDKVAIGVVAIIGDPVVQDVKKADSSLAFAEPPKSNSAKIIEQSLAAMDKAAVKPSLKVLLYNGPIDLAQKAAAAFPQFQIVVCRSEESEPPNAPLVVPQKNGNNSGSTLVIRVGHKGQNCGVVGVFADGKGGFDLQYQRVALTPEFETPEGKEDGNPALVELERYSKTVKDRDFLTKNRKVLHPSQVLNKDAKYAGSQSCVGCHNGPVHNGVDNSWTVYADSKHNQAYNALAKIAKRPSLRQFDGECIRCHTVGYDYISGFKDEVKTPALVNVGCESCHGPGSLHNANPNNKQLALALSPWKVNGQGKLPEVARIQEYFAETDAAKKQKILTPAEYQTMLRVDRTCQTCHNAENDPHFKFETFWPKIAHGVKPKPVP
jgi:hypothetical protein